MKLREDPLLDLEMCIAAHREVDRLMDKMSYYKLCIRERIKFIRHPEIAPTEPSPPGEKPDKPSRPKFGLKDHFSLRTKHKKSEYERACEEYNHQLKEYYIYYREYEKACDRYKEALQNWEVEKDRLLARSQEDVKQARKNIKKGNRLLKMYLEVIQNSQIHPVYQDIDTLQRFKTYLETGRAYTIQECINLYESETRWDRVRGSQERLENQLTATIHFLQNDLAQATTQAACAQDVSLEYESSPNQRRLFFFRRKKRPTTEFIPEFSLKRPKPGGLASFTVKLKLMGFRISRLSPFKQA